jgi:hypothetical protein
MKISVQQIEHALFVPVQSFTLPAGDGFRPKGFVTRNAIVVAALEHAGDAFAPCERFIH